MSEIPPAVPFVEKCNRRIGEIFTTVLMLIAAMVLARTLYTTWRAWPTYRNTFESLGIALPSTTVFVLRVSYFVYAHPFAVAVLAAMFIGLALFITWKRNWFAGVVVGVALLVMCTAYDMFSESSLRSPFEAIGMNVHGAG